MNKKTLYNVIEEVIHFFPDDKIDDLVKNAVQLGGSTNQNIRINRHVIRIPREATKQFFHRPAEFNNMEYASKQLELCDMPEYFNKETGLMVTKAVSPEIFLDKTLLDNDEIHKAVTNINILNGSGFIPQTAFNFYDAIQYFKTKNIAKEVDYLEKFEAKFFNTQNNFDLAMVEFSHNDPDWQNFTITKQVRDYEFSGNAPVLSDLANMISMNYKNESVFNYLKNADAPFEDLAPLVVFWLLFWGMWRIAKEDEDTPNSYYKKEAVDMIKYAIDMMNERPKNFYLG